MKGDRLTSRNALKLRRAAEEQILMQPDDVEATLKDFDSKRLYHELQVHQIELDMQHSELQRSHQALDLLLDQYATLYDFAPVSYMTLNREGTILKCNFSGGSLVGMVRSEINSLPFTRLVAEADRPLFESFLEKVFHEPPLETSCQLKLLKKGQTEIWVQLKGEVDESGQECLLAIVDAIKGKLTLSQASAPLSALSRRERETMKYVVEGKTNAAIAGLMNISTKSVETYRSRLMQKLGIGNVPELVKLALLHGVISL